MKIKRISKIDHFGIFKNFDWTTNLTYQNNKGQNEIYDFKDINIFYGRNYSGKTSLSKIIRSLEKQAVPPKYDHPNFKIELSDGSLISHNNLSAFAHPIHVYNSDFVKENLKFIHDENAKIESFSVTLGGNNQQILDQIQELKGELGSNEEDARSGFYLNIHNKNNELKNTRENHDSKKRDLEKLLTDKATRSSDSIKNQHEHFGNIRYDKRNLEADISEVQKSSFQVLSEDQKTEKLALIRQVELPNPPELQSYTLNFPSLMNSTMQILKTVVGGSQKIEELVQDSDLNSWVQQGHHLHKDRSNCAFCTNEINEQRQVELRQHFDNETQLLQNRIVDGIKQIKALLESQSFIISFDINHYYQKYHSALVELKVNLHATIGLQKISLEKIIKLLEQKNGKLFTQLEAEYPMDYSDRIKAILEQISGIRDECIQLNINLKTQQNEAKNALRLNHVYHFLQDINFTQQNLDINLAFQAIAPLETELTTLKAQKDAITAEIKTEEDKLKSEGEACIRINNILNHDFGHQALSLKAIDNPQAQNIHFEIQRNGAKAHNLSEGEQSLISFCYFLAKIQDDLDQDKKPILWIDDPICSLDNNHIYFTYSLLENICLNNKYGQLFISTHSLDFLKYLTQLTPIGKTDNVPKKERSFYQIEKTFLGSIIRKMSSHLEKNSSEFIYLFNIIYQCSLADEINDSNHLYFYNFANNARKFLEIYTYYLYPNPTLVDRQRLQMFWEDRLPRIFSERINHDGSHAVTILEGKITLRDFSEISTNAKLILSKLKERNTEQFKSLTDSIGLT